MRGLLINNTSDPTTSQVPLQAASPQSQGLGARKPRVPVSSNGDNHGHRKPQLDYL